MRNDTNTAVTYGGSVYDVIEESLEAILDERFPVHPLQRGVTKENVARLMQNYLAMSQAFPYIQAGTQKDFIFDVMNRNIDVPETLEKTVVVGSFLSWDETGGQHILRMNGLQALPEILNTRDHFHSNLLRKDLELLGLPTRPDYSSLTTRYLKSLYVGLSSFDDVTRAAEMVAFEAHAERMITALWNSLTKLFDVDPEKLVYFFIHVGGDDPAEEYHTAMTQRMVEDVVPADRLDEFFELFEQAYQRNYYWCEEIKGLTS